MGPQLRRFVPVLVLGLAVGACATSAKVATPPRDPASAVLSSAQADIRKIIQTADLTVRVADAGRASTQAARIVAEAGGVVFAQRSDLDGRRGTYLTLKVPPAQFEPSVTALGDLGRALRQESKAQDVTDQVVDVEGRLKTTLASADRLRALLGEARSTADVVGVEGELAKREAEIESLQGRLRVLDSQVDMATINLRLTERDDVELSHDVPGFTKALRAGSVTLLNLGLASAAVAGFVLPFTPFAVGGLWVVRRRRHLRS